MHKALQNTKNFFINERLHYVSQWLLIKKRKAADPLGQTALFWGFASVALSNQQFGYKRQGKSELLGLPPNKRLTRRGLLFASRQPNPDTNITFFYTKASFLQKMEQNELELFSFVRYFIIWV
jgi:hypothetical protein